MDITILGKTPISQKKPTGENINSDSIFNELQNEIAKLSKPSGGGPDWNKVQQMSIEILEKKSKHIVAASYLAVSLVRKDQFKGLLPGLILYKNLIETFWDNLYPPIKKEKQRKNAIDWWVDHMAQTLKSYPPPQSLDNKSEMTDCLAQIQEFFNSDKFQKGAPSLQKIKDVIADIPDASDEQTTSTQSQPEENRTIPEETTEPVKTPKPENVPQKPVSENKAQSPGSYVPPKPNQINTNDDFQKTIRSLTTSVRNIIQFKNDNITNPYIYWLSRFATWVGICELPGNFIPAPQETIINELNVLNEQKNWLKLLEFSESKVPNYPFWLDLNYYSALALSHMDDRYQDAHDIVCNETAFFVKRLYGIEKLCFQNQMPFASDLTKDWLNQITQVDVLKETENIPPVVTASADMDDSLQSTVEAARKKAENNQLEEAIQQLQQASRQSVSKKDIMLFRMVIAELLLHSSDPLLAEPHLEQILLDIDTYRLEEWDIDLTLKALNLVWSGFKNYKDTNNKERTKKILKKIAHIDPVLALKLGRK